MKVGFFLPSAFNARSAIWRKVLSQQQAVRLFGVEACVFSFSGPGSEDIPDHFHIPLGPGGTVKKERRVRALVQRVIQEQIDVVYVRKELWHPAYKELMQQVPTVVEINTLDRAEYKLTLPLWRRIYAGTTERCWRTYPSGYASVTKELTAGLPTGKPIEVISNGIPEPVTHVAPRSYRPHLLFSGTGSYAWHGIDKFVTMARTFSDWEFSFVGEFPQELEGGIPANMKCHGKMSSADADKLLARANIGVGTLALHRKGMDEACPLKLRSYLANGLPSIIAYEDTDFSGNFPFICQIRNAEENVISEQEKIRAFVLANYQQPVPWPQVSFASEKEKARLRYELFLKVMNQRKEKRQ